MRSKLIGGSKWFHRGTWWLFLLFGGFWVLRSQSKGENRDSSEGHQPIYANAQELYYNYSGKPNPEAVDDVYIIPDQWYLGSINTAMTKDDPKHLLGLPCCNARSSEHHTPEHQFIWPQLCWHFVNHWRARWELQVGWDHHCGFL